MTYTVRRVLPHEYGKYHTHLQRLDDTSKYLRFGFYIRDEVLEQVFDKIDADHQHHILFCIENDNLDFVAVGHIALGEDMELAFSVLKEYQGQGMGSALMKRCIQWCRTHNVLKGYMVCLSTNSTMRHLCAKYGIKLNNDDGETLANICLEQAHADTYIEELMDRNLAVLDWISKRALLPLTRLRHQLEVQ